MDATSGSDGEPPRGDEAPGGPSPAWLHDVPAPLLVLSGLTVLDANRAAAAELGRPVADVLGASLLASCRAGERDALREALAQLERGTTGEERRVTISVASGSTTRADSFFELRLRPIAGEPGRALALVVDVTEQHRLDAAVAALANATVALDASANMTWRPFGNARRFAVADEEALGVPVLEWIHPDELPHMLEVFAGLIAVPGSRATELVRMRHPYVEDGWLNSRITGVNLLDDPAMRAVVVRTEDAAPVDLVDDLTNTTGPFRSLAEVTPVGIVVTDREGRILYRNSLARELLGLARRAPAETPPEDWLAGLPSPAAAQLQTLLGEARDELRYGTAVISLRPHGDDGPTREGPAPEGQAPAGPAPEAPPAGSAAPTWLRVDVVPQVDEQGRSFGLIATLLDVTAETEARQQLADAQDRLWHLATHDPLTGLANRVLFLDRLGTALAQRADHGGAVALLYGDLDGFKPVNDLHGHSVGDDVLRIVAQRLRQVTRPEDVVGRFGGDEFLVLCTGFSSPEEIESLARRLAEAVQQPMAIGDLIVRVGMTVGVAFATADTVVDDLIVDADNSMYAGKAASRRP